MMTSFIPAAHAATININPNLPGMTNISTSGPVGWVTGFYTFALIISGILAFGAIVFGGVKYATSVGNPSAQSEGRAWIMSALLGLLLLGGAYLILQTINPNLVKLQIAPIASITPETAPAITNPGGNSNGPYGTGTSQSACSNVVCPTGSVPFNAQTFAGGGAQCSCQNANGKVFCGGQDNAQCPNDADGKAQTCVQTASNPAVYGCQAAVVTTCGIPTSHYGNCLRGTCVRTDNDATNQNVHYACQ